MNKTVFAAALGALLPALTALAAPSAPVPEAAELAQKLARDNACLSCHGVDRKLVGPAFRDIAARYANEDRARVRERLLARVKSGSKGTWGSVPMPPNPQVKPEDSTLIVDWVLGLR